MNQSYQLFKHTSSHPVTYLNAFTASSSEGVLVFLTLDKAPVAGEPISFTVKVANKHSTARMMKVHFNAQAKEYNNSPLDTFWETHGTIQLAPKEGTFTFYSSRN